MTTRFPDTPAFTGPNAPSRIECDLFDLVVEGTIPAEINGHWYRLTPDPQYPPMRGDDAYWSGDGMMSLFKIQNGRVSYKSRYVLTDRLKNDRAAGRSLYGDYRNPYTDDPSVRGQSRATVNTTPIWHGGRLLALKEDSRAIELDPHTLETIGEWDYDGKLRSETMTAHPRYDHDTGELVFFGYEAAGLATTDVAFCIADKNGRLTKEEWFKTPYVSFMHDFIVTKEHVVFPVLPFTADLERIKSGGPHWQWTPELDSFIGIMPRHGGVRDLRWFRGPAVYAAHFLNGFSDGHLVHMDFDYGKVTPLTFSGNSAGAEVAKFDPESQQVGRYSILGNMVRWTFDLSKPGETWQEHRIGPGGNFGCVAGKDHMRDYDIAYYSTYDPSVGPRFEIGPVGVGLNAIVRLQVKAGRHTTLSLGERITLQEHVHIPSKIPGHEGYLLLVADLHDAGLSDVVLVEAGHLDRGPIARVKLPLRLRCQIHGNWYDAGEF